MPKERKPIPMPQVPDMLFRRSLLLATREKVGAYEEMLNENTGDILRYLRRDGVYILARIELPNKQKPLEELTRKGVLVDVPVQFFTSEYYQLVERNADGNYVVFNAKEIIKGE